MGQVCEYGDGVKEGVHSPICPMKHPATTHSLCVHPKYHLIKSPAVRSMPDRNKKPIRATILANDIANPVPRSDVLVLVFVEIITVTLSPSSSTSRLRRSTGDILPGSAKPPSGASEQALFFVFLGILVGLELVHFRCPEKSSDEYD